LGGVALALTILYGIRGFGGSIVVESIQGWGAGLWCNDFNEGSALSILQWSDEIIAPSFPRKRKFIFPMHQSKWISAFAEMTASRYRRV
jgi:hypothetical protein